MTTLKTETTEVIYNAAAQAFEAKVTIHDGSETFTYPCAIAAPITMSFDRASKGLIKQALRQHGRPATLRSYIMKASRSFTLRTSRPDARRGLPLGQYGFFRGRAA